MSGANLTSTKYSDFNIRLDNGTNQKEIAHYKNLEQEFRILHKDLTEDLCGYFTKLKETRKKIKSVYSTEALKDQRSKLGCNMFQANILIKTIKDKITDLNIPNEATKFLRTLLQGKLKDLFMVLEGFKEEQSDILNVQLKNLKKRSPVKEQEIDERGMVIKEIMRYMEDVEGEIEDVNPSGDDDDDEDSDDDSRKIMQTFDLVFEERKGNSDVRYYSRIEDYVDQFMQSR